MSGCVTTLPRPSYPSLLFLIPLSFPSPSPCAPLTPPPLSFSFRSSPLLLSLYFPFFILHFFHPYSFPLLSLSPSHVPPFLPLLSPHLKPLVSPSFSFTGSLFTCIAFSSIPTTISPFFPPHPFFFPSFFSFLVLFSFFLLIFPLYLLPLLSLLYPTSPPLHASLSWSVVQLEGLLYGVGLNTGLWS